MSNREGNDFGRYRHLGQLALVFRHRHGTWEDLGQFLKHLFSDSPRYGVVATAPRRVPVACRHNSGGKHHHTLTDVAQYPENYPMFNHERYTRPCFGIGAFEDQKNPGLVVADICSKASRFLLSIGKGDQSEVSGRDFEYDPTREDTVRGLESVGSSQVTDSQGSLDSGNIIEDQRRIAGNSPLASPAEDSEFDDSFFHDVDVQQELTEILERVDEEGSRPRTRSTMETPYGFRESEDSIVQSLERQSTKIRAATLGYLWQFADNPLELREQFRRLRSDRDLQVLHLCGCGICYTNSTTGNRVIGCVDKTHLKLGSAVENGIHKIHHQGMSLGLASDYPVACLLVHRADHGGDLF
jgi:hypothetical protein